MAHEAKEEVEGRGRHTPPAAHARDDRKPKFQCANPDLPTLNFGASAKENKPIEFLQLMGEYMSIHFKPSICFAFWSSPPEFGPEEDEPVMPYEIPAGNPWKIVIAVWGEPAEPRIEPETKGQGEKGADHQAIWP